jgi:hypothetical protein
MMFGLRRAAEFRVTKLLPTSGNISLAKTVCFEDQVSSIAFDRDGNLFAGTQCHGLAIFERDVAGKYSHVRNIVAQNRFGVDNCSPVPLEVKGVGLPSDQINDVILDRGNDIRIATSAGMVRFVLGGKTDFLQPEYTPQLAYVRGRNYADKVRGLFGGAPKDWKECSKEENAIVLPEDYVTTLAVDNNGTIWYGFRQSGAMAVDPETQQILTVNNKQGGLSDNFVTKILPMRDGRHFFGTYGGGVMRSQVDLTLHKRKLRPLDMYEVAKEDYEKLPATAKILTLDQLEKMERKLGNQTGSPNLPTPYATYWGEDWKTQGDWTGRIYHEWAISCATQSPANTVLFHSNFNYNVKGSIGPNHPRHKDTLRLYNRGNDNNPKTLWISYSGVRRQAEWDDHGEVYPWHIDGPDIWYLLEIKHKGTFRISMYFVNPDGHSGANRMRDYLIEFYPTDMKWVPQRATTESPGVPSKIIGVDMIPLIGRNGEKLTRQMPPLARSRVRDFWGGVHAQFIVTGQQNYLVKVDRNYSFNTIMSSVAIAQVYGEPTDDVKKKYGIPYMPVPYEAPPYPKNTGEQDQYTKFVFTNWKYADLMYSFQGGIELQRKSRILIYQTAYAIVKNNKGNKFWSEFERAMKWELNIWNDEQRKEWNETMQRGWEKLYKSNSGIRRAADADKNGTGQKDLLIL